MSIVIALGVTTPETSYSDMAAGSDPESVEASPAVNEKNFNHSCGSAQSHGYRSLPYAMQQSSVVCCQDHNYGAPPPPTPPASPLSQTIIPRMELNGVVRASRYQKSPEDNSADSDSSSDDEPPNSSWCQCSLTADNILIKCDHCRDIESCKREKGHTNTENVSEGESSATESGDEEVSPSTVSYTATQHTPTSIKLTVNRVKRSKSKKRKKSTEKSRGVAKAKKVKAFREGSRKSMRMKNSTTDASVLDENTSEGWENKIRKWTDQYEEALTNQYSADVQSLLQNRSEGSQSPLSQTSPAELSDTLHQISLSSNNTVLGSQMQLQLGRVTRVQKHRKILRAAKTLEPDTLIIEYRGKVMLKQQFEVNGHFFKKPYPFVLFYSKYNDVDMCVDARTFGNDARFIRRSCTPNAEVRHMISEGMIHLCIFAVSQITKDSEVTIGFDFEFNSCNYKVDCACHKGNENCPVQKHNLKPTDLLSPPSLLPPAPLIGAETRRRKAQRKGQEGSSGDTSLSTEAKDTLGVSDTEEKPSEELKPDEKDMELFENGVPGPSNKTPNNAEKRRRKAGFAELKEECVEADSRSVAVGSQATPTTGVGMSTRRTTYVTDPTPADEKTSLSVLPPPVPAKPARPAKPRPKSRMSRYRSTSSQRARRQRQALAQQAAAAAAAAAAAVAASGALVDQGAAQEEEASQGPYGAEQGEGFLGSVGLFDEGQGPNCIHRGNFRYPKTKKYLVTEWLNDKVPGGEKMFQEFPVERPLRITTDPTVLATTLNMLPGLSHTSMICTTPRQYIRFGSPFNPERRRPRPLQMDGTYGCYKKRWIKQMEDESCSVSVEDGTESTLSQKSTSSRSTPNPLPTEGSAPIKKRRSKYLTESTPANTSDHLLRPLSPITPPPPDNHLLLHTACLSNGLFSPLPSLPTSRCNTPLQFENISSPEASPVHRPESISPEPCVQTDYDISRPQFLEVSLSSSLESPAAVMSDEYSLPGGALGPDSQGPTLGTNSLNQASCLSSDQSREQNFKTEFNLIYTCSPLNANLGNAGPSDQRLPKAECFSPADSLHSSLSGHGLMGDHGSMSPYGDTLYGGMYPDSGTPPHMGNQPQKKKVSLLEYRKRKRSCGRDPESLSATHTPISNHYIQDTHHTQRPQHRASPHPYPPSAPPYSSPHTEAVSPSEPQTPVSSRHQDNQWMVPTSVERLREGQGVLERVLRSIKSERTYKHGDGSSDKECVYREPAD
ncbi:unnamed protein product [Knipowitschia caucasica]|uniref:SET domain-containing protein n=1 Tax=Knipowitschia caucasica TaxID=637954 RepID=A0AAV2M669_KNICA